MDGTVVSSLDLVRNGSAYSTSNVWNESVEGLSFFTWFEWLPSAKRGLFIEKPLGLLIVRCSLVCCIRLRIKLSICFVITSLLLT